MQGPAVFIDLSLEDQVRITASRFNSEKLQLLAAILIFKVKFNRNV